MVKVKYDSDFEFVFGHCSKKDRYLNGLYIRFVGGGMYEAWNVQVAKNIARIKKYYRRGY